MAEVPTVKLHNGVEMPQLGFGVFQMTPEEAKNFQPKIIFPHEKTNALI